MKGIKGETPAGASDPPDRRRRCEGDNDRRDPPACVARPPCAAATQQVAHGERRPARPQGGTPPMRRRRPNDQRPQTRRSRPVDVRGGAPAPASGRWSASSNVDRTRPPRLRSLIVRTPSPHWRSAALRSSRSSFPMGDLLSCCRARRTCDACRRISSVVIAFAATSSVRRIRGACGCFPLDAFHKIRTMD